MNDQSISRELWGFKFLGRPLGGRCGKCLRADARTPQGLLKAGSRVWDGSLHGAPSSSAGAPVLCVLGGKGHISLTGRPSARGLFRDSLKIPWAQTWHSAGSLCASACMYGTQTGTGTVGFSKPARTIWNDACVCSRKYKTPKAPSPHAQRQMLVHTGRVPGPSIPISSDR